MIGNATAFPVAMARGAAWDPDLEERVGDAIGRELRASGADLTGAVCVNVLRHPGWGRAQETYGEDPFHVGELGAALTRGLQRHVLACVKHFACNSMEEARFRVDIEVDEVALHEVYLPHFRRIVDEGVASVMTAYNSVEGEWCGQSTMLLADVLRGEWGFEGLVISDFIFGIRDAARSLRRARHRDAVPDGPRPSTWPERWRRGRRRGTTSIAPSSGSWRPGSGSTMCSRRSRRPPRRSARPSIEALARGGGPLGGAPPERAGRRRCPAPAGAEHAARCDRVARRSGEPRRRWVERRVGPRCRTVVDGLRERFDEVVHDDGADPLRAAATAADADVAAVVVGFTHLDEGEYIGAADPALAALFPGRRPRGRRRLPGGSALAPVARPAHHDERPTGFSEGGDRRDLRLAAGDVALIRAVAAVNPRTIVVLQAGSAVVVDEWVDAVPAVVQAWYGGCEAGPGLADVLSGDVAPSGRLPFSVPHDEADLPAFDPDASSFRYDRWHGWRHLGQQGTPAAFPFGFGLTYTTFEVRAVQVDVAEDGIEVRATVANTGERDAADVLQVYAVLPDADRPPRLVGFVRVEVAAGEGEAVAMVVPLDRLATRDASVHAWRPATGRHELVVGRFAGDPASVVVPVEL
ncbi:MAG: glycoside hydrolase family 3 N-terminal domain-containing protein [Acidimicrobiales bacterium]